MAKLAKQAINIAGVNKKIIGVSRFSEKGLQTELNEFGIVIKVLTIKKKNKLTPLI